LPNKSIKLPVHATIMSTGLFIKEACRADGALVRSLFRKKRETEERNGREFLLNLTLELPHQRRTSRQNATIWTLVTAIFESMEGRKPDEAEKRGLYTELLDLYGVKKPGRLTGKLVPVHISEADSWEAAQFIDALIVHLASTVGLSLDIQAQVYDVMRDFQSWRGRQELDPLDYRDAACTVTVTEAEWRERHPMSEASGKGGTIHLHHIIHRGARPDLVDKPWNWLALTVEEHAELHSRGEAHFLRVYPHLGGKFGRARRLAGEGGR